MLSISNEAKSQIIKSTIMIVASAGVITVAALVIALVVPKLQAVVTNLSQAINQSKHLYEWKTTLIVLAKLAKTIPDIILAASCFTVVIFKIVAFYNAYKIFKAITDSPIEKPIEATHLPPPTFTQIN